MASTKAAIQEIIDVIDSAIKTVITDKGVLGLAQFDERGPEGFKIDPTLSLKELRELREDYIRDLDNLNFEDPSMGTTVHDNPAI